MQGKLYKLHWKCVKGLKNYRLNFVKIKIWVIHIQTKCITGVIDDSRWPKHHPNIAGLHLCWVCLNHQANFSSVTIAFYLTVSGIQTFWVHTIFNLGIEVTYLWHLAPCEQSITFINLGLSKAFHFALSYSVKDFSFAISYSVGHLLCSLYLVTVRHYKCYISKNQFKLL